MSVGQSLVYIILNEKIYIIKTSYYNGCLLYCRRIMEVNRFSIS